MRRVLLTALLPLVCAAAAPEPPAAPAARSAALGEDDAVSLALQDNPDLRAFRKQRAVAEGGIVSATALQNPTLRLEMLHVQEGSAMGFGSTLKWAPPQPAEWTARRAQARARVDEIRYAITEREWQLTALVRGAYRTILALREQERLCGSILALRRRMVALLASRVARGGATRLEQNLAELSALNAQREHDAITLRQIQAQAQLRALLGIVSGDPIEVTGTLAEPDRSELPEPGALAARALSARPLLRALSARSSGSEQGVRIEKARRWPWLELSGRYRENGSAKYAHDVQLAVELSLPILNTNAGPLRVAAAQLDYEQAQAQAQAQALTQGIYAACAELRVHRDILRRFRREVLPVLTEHERLMELAARGAEVDVVALLGSEESVLRGRREYGDARLSYERAWLLLEAAAGMPLQEVAR